MDLIEHLDLVQIYEFEQFLNLSSYVSGNDLYRAASNKSTNKVWIRKTESARSHQEEIGWLITAIPDNIVKSTKAYTMELEFHRRPQEWVFKNGKLKRLDLSNLTKVVEDGICNALNLDDSLCVNLKVSKVIYTGKDSDMYPVGVKLKLFS